MISVIIPTYKTTHALDLCLESVIKGQHNQNQIIVVVDGHYDVNEEVLKKYADHIDVLDLTQNVGACKALNLGVYNAQYDKILMVNDDNVFPKNWDVILEEEWEACTKNYPQGFVLTPNQIEPYSSMFKQFIIEDLGRDPRTFDLERFWSFNDSISCDRVEENGSTWPVLMNKYDYLKVGGFAEDYPSQAGFVTDWEFFMKLQMSGLRMLRTWNCHFYHFVALSNKSPEQINQSKQEESACHEYSKYKWGSYIHHHPDTNHKFII